MAKKNILDLILTTINDVQKRNAANPREETADPTVFDLIKSKLQNLDQKSRQKRAEKGKSPDSILDLIRQQIEGARTENKADPNVRTAPDSVFDNIIKKVGDRSNRRASSGLRRIVEEYNLDVSRVPREVLQQVQQKIVAEQKNFDQQFAQAIHNLTQKY